MQAYYWPYMYSIRLYYTTLAKSFQGQVHKIHKS